MYTVHLSLSFPTNRLSKRIHTSKYYLTVRWYTNIDLRYLSSIHSSRSISRINRCIKLFCKTSDLNSANFAFLLFPFFFITIMFVTQHLLTNYRATTWAFSFLLHLFHIIQISVLLYSLLLKESIMRKVIYYSWLRLRQ